MQNLNEIRKLAGLPAKTEVLNEGFMDFSVSGSDSAADLWYSVCNAAAKTLKAGLRDKGNEYNTHGTLNVGMILVEKFKSLDGDLDKLGNEVKARLETEIEKMSGTSNKSYVSAMKRVLTKLENMR